jgi:hypothetical protein
MIQRRRKEMRLKWVMGDYGFWYARVGRLVKISVGWNITQPKNVAGGYSFRVNDMDSKRTYELLDECKKAAEKSVEVLLAEAMDCFKVANNQ